MRMNDIQMFLLQERPQTQRRCRRVRVQRAAAPAGEDDVVPAFAKR